MIKLHVLWWWILHAEGPHPYSLAMSSIGMQFIVFFLTIYLDPCRSISGMFSVHKKVSTHIPDVQIPREFSGCRSLTYELSDKLLDFHDFHEHHDFDPIPFPWKSPYFCWSNPTLGFTQMGDTPIAGWFISYKSPISNGEFGGTPWLRKPPYMDISFSITIFGGLISHTWWDRPQKSTGFQFNPMIIITSSWTIEN